MPIGGSGPSPATRITSGPAFDMQPRFSPDGKRIAFSSATATGSGTSGRSAPDGKDAQQVSKEKRWFVNSPTWARRRQLHLRAAPFRQGSARSARARSGCSTPTGPRACRSPRRTASRRMPASRRFPPDGRYLYYSKDVTPGQTVRIQQGPERRRSTRSSGAISTTGRERRIVSASRAARSRRVRRPDGKSLAYVRRVRLQSKLFVRDLETGRDRVVFDHLDKDLQEAWADPRPLPAVRVDARRQGARRSGAKARSGASTWQAAKASVDPVHRARRADDQRRGALPAEGLHAGVPGQDAARRRDVAGREAGRLRRARADLRQVRFRRAIPKPVTGDRWIRVRPVVVARRPVDRLHDLERRRLRTRARHEAGRHRRPRRRDQARALHRAVILARRQDRSSSATPAPTSPAGSLYGVDAGIYVVPADGSAPPRLVREGGTRADVRSHRQADLPVRRRPRRQVRPVQRRHWRSTGPLCRRGDEVVHFQSENADADRAVAGRQVGRVRGAVARLRRAVPAHRPPGRSWIRRSAAIRRRASRATRVQLPALVGRQPAGLLVAGPGALHARSRADLHVPRSQPRRSPTSPKPRACRSASPPSPTCRTARSRSSARASSRWPTLPAPGTCRRGRDRERHGRRRGQPDHGDRARGIVAIPAGAKRIDARRQDDHAGHRRRPRAMSAARGTASWRSRAGRSLANLAFGVTTSHDPSNDTETVFANAELIRAGAEARAAPVLDRHDPLRRRDAVQGGRSRATTTRCRICGGRRRSARSASRATTSSGATRGR